MAPGRVRVDASMRLLFLHGGGLTKAMWRPQLDALGDEFDVAAVDLPGHGERASERFSFPAAVAVVEETVGSSSPAVLVGLSLGGYAAMATTRERPDLASGLVLTGCSVDYSRGGQRFVALAAEGFHRVWPKRLLRSAQGAAFRRDYEPWAEEIIGAGHFWRGYADALREARRIRWHGCLASYEGSVLVLNGEKDTPHVRAQAKLLDGVEHGRAELVPGAAHLANLDRPEEYTESVRRFAGSLGDPFRV
jgi:pimeloyl-ACP methyl ester carboxylesterase